MLLKYMCNLLLHFKLIVLVRLKNLYSKSTKECCRTVWFNKFKRSYYNYDVTESEGYLLTRADIKNTRLF